MEILSALALARFVTSALMGPFAPLGSHMASVVLSWNMWLGEALFPSRSEGRSGTTVHIPFRPVSCGWGRNSVAESLQCCLAD